MRPIPLFTLQALLLAGLLGTAPAPAAGDAGSELQMAQQSEPFRELAEAFVARALAGELAATQAMLSRAMVERSGEANVRHALAAQILPFFRSGLAIGNSRTITRTTDASGQQGFAFYLWLTQRDGGAPRPFTVYAVDEAGQARVANIVPDRLVPGRHR